MNSQYIFLLIVLIALIVTVVFISSSRITVPAGQFYADGTNICHWCESTSRNCDTATPNTVAEDASVFVCITGPNYLACYEEGKANTPGCARWCGRLCADIIRNLPPNIVAQL